MLSVADLAAVIAGFLFAPMVGEGWMQAWRSNGRTLYAAERVCVALRAAVAPLWRQLYLGLTGGRILLPSAIVASDAAQWRHLLYMRARPLDFKIIDQGNCEVHFKARSAVRGAPPRCTDAHVLWVRLHVRYPWIRCLRKCSLRCVFRWGSVRPRPLTKLLSCAVLRQEGTADEPGALLV